MGFACVGRLAMVVVGSVEGAGVAGALEMLELLEELVGIEDGTFGWPLKLLLS